MSSANPTLMNTYKKMFNFPENAEPDRKISRHDFVSASALIKSQVEKFDKVEAFFVHAAYMNLADVYELDKFPEEGGKEYTLDQLCDVLHSLPIEKIRLNAAILQRAFFRAIDTDSDGYIGKEEWIRYLKLRNFYENDAKALQAFNNLDANKNGFISPKECEESSFSFWATKGTEKKNLYGTASQ